MAGLDPAIQVFCPPDPGSRCARQILRNPDFAEV